MWAPQLETPLFLLIILVTLMLIRRPEGSRMLQIGVGLLLLAGALIVSWFLKPEAPTPGEVRALPTHVAEGIPGRRSESDMLSSDACRSCHPSEYASWAQTYHRTMTAPATPEYVLGDFNGVTLSARGLKVKLSHQGDQYLVEQITPAPGDGQPQVRPVVMTTGSHNLQNYWFSNPNGQLVQFKFAWLARDQRWIPTADSFLQSPQEADAPGSTIWNDACNPCHTVGSVARRDYDKADSEVVELGIACEACHGAGEAHVKAYQSPLSRYQRHLAASEDEDEGDPTVTNAARLKPATSVAACGQCHGLYLTRDARQVNQQGDPFRAGDAMNPTREPIQFKPDPLVPGGMLMPPLEGKRPRVEIRAGLLDLQNPPAEPLPLIGHALITGTTQQGVHLSLEADAADHITEATPVTLILFPSKTPLQGHLSRRGEVALLAPGRWHGGQGKALMAVMGYDQNQPTPRDMTAFWGDGTMRTAGREYNAHVTSTCYTRGGMTCVSCHSMHSGQADDMMKRDLPTSGPGANKACTACHPAYQDTEALQAHTHHPPEGEGSLCYNCHMPHTTYGLLGAIRAHRVDSPSAERAARTGRPDACSLCHLDKPLQWTADQLTARHGAPEVDLAQKHQTTSATLLWLMEGDAAQRAIVAWHFGWAPARAISGSDTWGAPLLSHLLEDEYAVVRYIAARALRQQTAFSALDYDYVSAPEARQSAAESVRSTWSKDHRADPTLTPERAAALGLTGPGQIDEAAIQALIQHRDTRPVFIAE